MTIRHIFRQLLILPLLVLTSPYLKADDILEELKRLPATRLDLGLLAINTMFADFNVNGIDTVSVRARYNDEEHLIDIHGTALGSYVNKGSAKENCEKIIAQMKLRLGILPTTGAPVSGKHSILVSYFAGYEFFSKAFTDKYAAIDDVTRLKVDVLDTNGPNHASCSSDLREGPSR